MEVIKINIKKDISGELYYRLIDYAVGHYPLFLFVKRKDINPSLSTDGEKVIQKFFPFLHITTESFEWPGTKVIKSAELYYFNLTDESAVLLKELSNSLFSWQHPAFPEDLCIMRNMEQPWLCNIAHEKIAMFYISSSEKAELLMTIPELSSFLGKEEKAIRYY